MLCVSGVECVEAPTCGRWRKRGAGGARYRHTLFAVFVLALVASFTDAHVIMRAIAGKLVLHVFYENANNTLKVQLSKSPLMVLMRAANTCAQKGRFKV